ncbi:hypothetical protein LGV61_02285 [Desulfurispirillum indicum]|uniref:hypothetical protein n=1 Tax=Desulfurispirillum indicum TaxID=936456 RepID=UPI001CFA751A|nr:hypothetical protein [Desulfurispirillum indicum]UCZ57125.1 hypothetical protein LGV61_02285 [Desulfurispirillum indicum]
MPLPLLAWAAIAAVGALATTTTVAIATSEDENANSGDIERAKREEATKLYEKRKREERERIKQLTSTGLLQAVRACQKQVSHSQSFVFDFNDVKKFSSAQVPATQSDPALFVREHLDSNSAHEIIDAIGRVESMSTQVLQASESLTSAKKELTELEKDINSLEKILASINNSAKG